VEQIEAPITVDSLAYLFDSEWPLSAIRAFAVDRLTPDYETQASALEEKELDELRRYVLIIKSSTEPQNPYVSFYDKRRQEWLYIDAKDKISQKNFEFLVELLTMQAVSPPPPLTPTLPVGGRGG
jgi:hypothetical protein